MTPGLVTFYFSIPGLLRARVCGPAFLMAPVIREFAFHQEQSPPAEDKLDLEITLAPLGPPGHETAAFAWRGKHLAARWRASLRPPGLLAFRGNRFSRFIVSKWIVEPALRIAAEQKGAAMVHAAAIADGERALLVAGPGGAGKTTWALNWLGAGHPYLGDDFSIVKSGEVLAYVTPLRLGFKNLVVNRSLSGLDWKDKAEIAARTALRRALLGRVKLYFKTPVQRAMPGARVAKRARLAGALWLERGLPARGPKDKHGATPEPGKKRSLCARAMAELMAEVDLAEMHGFAPAPPIPAKGSNQPARPAESSQGPRLPSPEPLSHPLLPQHLAMLQDALADKPCFCVPARCLPPRQAMTSVNALLAWAAS